MAFLNVCVKSLSGHFNVSTALAQLPSSSERWDGPFHTVLHPRDLQQRQQTPAVLGTGYCMAMSALLFENLFHGSMRH